METLNETQEQMNKRMHREAMDTMARMRMNQTRNSRRIEVLAIQRFLELYCYEDIETVSSQMWKCHAIDYIPKDILSRIAKHIEKMPEEEFRKSLFRSTLWDIAKYPINPTYKILVGCTIEYNYFKPEEKALLTELFNEIDWTLKVKRRKSVSEEIQLTNEVKLQLARKIEKYVMEDDLKSLYALAKDLVNNYSVEAYNFAFEYHHQARYRKSMKDRENS